MTKSRFVSVSLAALVLAGGCASPTRPVDRYPGETQQDYGTEAYQAEGLSGVPATGADAAITAGAAAVDSALGIGSRSPSAAASGSSIEGHCEMVDTDPPVPCAFIVVILKDGGHVFESQTRTDEEGNFSFRVKRGRNYYLEPGGTHFTAEFSEPTPFKAGMSVWMRLRTKKL